MTRGKGGNDNAWEPKFRKYDRKLGYTFFKFVNMDYQISVMN